MAKLFVTLSREEAEVAAPVESTPMKGSEASDVIENAQDVAEETQQVEEMIASIEEAEDALDDLQEAENMAAASAGEEPVDVVTGEPVAGTEDSECCDETPGVTEPTPTGTEEAVAAPAPEVAAAVATECLRQVKKRLGIDSEGIQVSFESLDSRSPISSLQLAREGIGDTAKKIWDAIKAMFKKIWDKIKELWGKFTGLFKKKAEVVEQVVEEVKEAEEELKKEGIKLSAADFTSDQKKKIAEACAICIGKNSDAMDNLELAAKKIAANANAIKAAAKGVASIPAKAGKSDINEIVTSTLESIKGAYSIDMSISGGSTDNKFNRSDIQIATNIFDGDVVYATKLDKGAIASITDKLAKAKEVVSHDFATAKVDGFKDSAAINRLMNTIAPLDSSTFAKLGGIVKTAAIKDYPSQTVASTSFSDEGNKAIAELEKLYNKKREKGDEKIKFDSDVNDGMSHNAGGIKKDTLDNAPKLGGFINKLMSSAGLRSNLEVKAFIEAVELWGKETLVAAKRKKTPKEK